MKRHPLNYADFFFCIEIGLDIVIKGLIVEFPHLIEFKDAKNLTPLLNAAHHKHLGIVNMLIELGANRDATDKYKQNVLHHLLKTQPEIKDVKYFNFVVKKAMTWQNVNQADEDGFTSLFAAVWNNNLSIVKEHLKYNINFNIESKGGSLRGYG